MFSSSPKEKHLRKKRVEKILYKLEYRILSFFGWAYRNIRYNNTYFFDTNFVVTKETKLDKRYSKLFLKTGKLYITEQVKVEVEEKLKLSHFRKINKSKLKICSFDSLSEKTPICPTYYNFIGSMHNPANVACSDFPLQMVFSKIIKGHVLTKNETQIRMLLMDGKIAELKSEIDEDGSKKSEHSKAIDEALLRSIKKRADGLRGKNKNYANDLRSLATFFLYSMLYKRNTTFVTSDSDFVSYFFDWSTTMIQEVVFTMKILEEFKKNDKHGMKKFMAGKKEALFFDTNKLFSFIGGTLQRFLGNKTKYFAPRLTIKYWDKSRQKFFVLNFNVDKSIRMLFLSAHGNLNCPTTKNDTMGSFIGYKYWWPPSSIHSLHLFKILPILKPIHRTSQKFPPGIHDCICKYRKFDISNNFDIFSSFT